jgi:uncharacterized protein (DUF488 family)
LQAHEIQLVADVRRFPASRRHPHFSRERLEALLAGHAIRYQWIPALGGRRVPRPDSRNTGWRQAAFRGYADYMDTPEFREALDGLLAVAGSVRTAIMCAEALWWQCHRRLIADALVSGGHEVLHIQSRSAAPPHKLLAPAHMQNGKLSYAADQADLL